MSANEQQAEKKQARLRVGDDWHVIPAMADWTLDEAEAVEQIVGGPFEECDPASKRVLRALAWLTLHRTDETITPSSIGSLRLGEFEGSEDVVQEAAVPIPPEGGGALTSQNGSAATPDEDSDLVTHPPVPGAPLSAVSTD